MTRQIQSYLRALKRQLRRRGLFNPESLAEVESHLIEAVEAGMARGLNLEEAERQGWKVSVRSRSYRWHSKEKGRTSCKIYC